MTKLDFRVIKNAVAKQFDRMTKHELFRTDVTKDAMWTTYLGAFPAGTDPVYKTRTEHDCQCCKQFIRAVGDVVAIIDGKIESIWDIDIPTEPGYQTVANAMAALVKSKPIVDKFYHYDKSAGTDKSHFDTGVGVGTFLHFFVNIPAKFVMRESDIATELGKLRSTKDVFTRALETISQESIDTVLDLIAQNSLYRGTEDKFSVTDFEKHRKAYMKLKPGVDRVLYVWDQVKTLPGSVSGIRNSSVGKLLVDLSEGRELEAAVGAYETMKAGPNYKRPTALVSKAMIEKARKTITELGLNSALERRYATLADITINNVLYADRTSRKQMDGDVFDDLASTVKQSTKALDKVEEVSIEKFLSDILPRAESIEIMMGNEHQNNLVSLIAPVDATSNNLFKWNNKFSWSYNGEFADSIKERVKAAGGNVTGQFCCRLAWNYEDDLDFHMTEPNGFDINFRNRRQTSFCGGTLDVDANGADGIRKDPCENIYYNTISSMKEGTYKLSVHNYSRRSTGRGFEVEIDILGDRYNFVYDKVIGDSKWVEVATFKYSRERGLELVTELTGTKAVKQIWNVSTNTFQKVSVIMNSPNYWDDQQNGNKHYFFMLEGCKNEGKARGFFNEYLKADLDKHRKVLEMVGAKMKTEESDNQLSGLGFSSTQRNSVLCRVKGSFTRLVKITF